MPDREKVMNWLKELAEPDWKSFHSISEVQIVAQDALALLKEQEAVVRCKDCKHGEKAPTFKYYPDVTWCNKYLTSHNDDWFCADGERK